MLGAFPSPLWGGVRGGGRAAASGWREVRFSQPPPHPVAAFKLAITVARLPKTRSGKILRGTMKKIADGETWTMPATIEDPKVLEEIGGALKGKGVGG